MYFRLRYKFHCRRKYIVRNKQFRVQRLTILKHELWKLNVIKLKQRNVISWIYIFKISPIVKDGCVVGLILRPSYRSGKMRSFLYCPWFWSDKRDLFSLMLKDKVKCPCSKRTRNCVGDGALDYAREQRIPFWRYVDRRNSSNNLPEKYFRPSACQYLTLLTLWWQKPKVQIQ